jgi:hypothetical protein
VCGKLGPVRSTPFHVWTEELSVVRHRQNLVWDQQFADEMAKDCGVASRAALERYSSAYVWNCRVRR